MADIFLSYNEKDREQARRVATLLTKSGWSVWWDRRIPAGETWRSVLEEALEGMRCMIVLWTAHSIESEWVFEEASEGRRQDKLIPIMLEDVRPPPGFREIQAANLTGWDGTATFEGWRLLLVDLEHLLGAPPAASHKAAVNPAPSNVVADRDASTSASAGSDSTLWPRRRLAAVLLGLVALSGIAYLALKPSPPAVTRPSYPPGMTEAIVPKIAPEKSVQAKLPEHSTEEPAKASGSVLAPHQAASPGKAATVASAARPPVTTAMKQSNARCADLLSRLQLGESLSDEAQAVLQKECKQ